MPAPVSPDAERMEETMKHTPGPWEVTQRSAGEWGSAGQWGVAAHYLDRGGQRRRIAMCGSPRTYSNPELDAEDRANARLIAAAPDLLAALRAMVALDECEAHFEEAYERILPEARAAIAKATGAA
jgi:dTDP-4-dehydrorhamnose reductase